MQKRQFGFNMIELMMGLSIAGVLLAVGTPAMRDLTVRQRITAGAQELQLDITLARQEAVTRGSPVSVCVSTDGADCTGGTDWAQGRIVFDDINGNGIRNGAEQVIRVSRAMPTGLAVPAAVSGLTFTALGMLTGAGTTMTLCKPEYEGRVIRIRRTGHPSIEKTPTVCT